MATGSMRSGRRLCAEQSAGDQISDAPLYTRTARLTFMNAHRTLFVYALATLALLCMCCSAEQPSVVIQPHNGTPVTVSVELARTAGQRSMGLMYRKKLGISRGMLFLFEHDEKHMFTMRNTSIPLDMIFINSALTVAGIVENAKPYANGPFGIDLPSRYVLEVNAGFCARHAIAAGDSIVFHTVPGHD